MSKVIPQALTQATIAKLRSLIERVETIDENLKQERDERAAVFAEAKAMGFDTKAMRAVLRVRKADKAKLEEEQQIRELYLHALGELGDAFER